jgi:hypothetical protein
MMQKTNEEVELTQYLRPDGRKSLVYAPVGEEYVKKSEGMVLSTEVLGTGKVAIYGRYNYEPEEKEVLLLANNFDDDKGPTNVLKQVIDRVYSRTK